MGARLIVVTDPGATSPDGAIVLEAPEMDPDGAFAELVGTYAAALDAGGDPAGAFEEVVAGLGWSRPEA